MSKRYSISTDGEYVAPHFGRCPSYTIVDIDGDSVVKKETIPNPGHATGAIPQYMAKLNVNTMIAGGMGRRALEFFQQFNIETVTGASGKIDDLIETILKGELKSGASSCSPGLGRGYGVPKTDGGLHESEPPEDEHEH